MIKIQPEVVKRGFLSPQQNSCGRSFALLWKTVQAPGQICLGIPSAENRYWPNRRRRWIQQHEVNASFLGFGPSETPKLLGLVVLREPQTAITYGGTLAAPPLARILADSFAHLGVAPQLEKKEEEDSLVTVPNVRNYPPGEAQQLLLSQGLTFQLEGAGKMVTEQNPKPGVRVKKGTKVIIYCGRAELDNKGDGLVTVPPLEKMTIVTLPTPEPVGLETGDRGKRYCSPPGACCRPEGEAGHNSPGLL